MAARDNDRGPLETVTLAGIGALALAAGRLDDFSEDLAARLGVDRDEMQAALGDALSSWRREAHRLGLSGGVVARAAEDLGVASQESLDELALRVAQLEHRLKLLEG